MKKLLILALLLLTALLATACTAPTDTYSVADLKLGMKRADVLKGLDEASTTEAQHYVFFVDSNNKSVVLYFNNADELSRIEAYDAPATDPTASVRSELPVGSSVYDVVKKLGVPAVFTKGSFYQLSFVYPASEVITTWQNTDSDAMSLSLLPYYID